MSLLLALLTFVLVIVSLFMVLVILMQRAKSDGGVGAALGGGMAESAFGGETANVLTKATQVGVVLFFVLAFAIYLGRLHLHRAALADADSALPAIEAPALPPVEGAQPTLPPLDAAPLTTNPTPDASAMPITPESTAPSTTTPPASAPEATP